MRATTPADRLVWWWRIRERDRRKAAGLRRADAVICSHGKSGRTWLRAMIGHVYHQLYGTPADLLIQHDNLKRHDARVPSVHFGQMEIRRHRDGRVLARAQPHQSVVFLLRDPRDVAVSFHHHLRHRATPLELRRKRVSEEVLRLELFEFMLHPGFGLPSVIERLNAFVAAADAFSGPTFVTYEALRQDTVAELRRVMRALGETPPAAVLEAAAAFADFDALGEKEHSGFFRGDRLKPVTTGGTEAPKVRRGEIGGYRRHFSAEQLAVLDDMVEERLDPALGYGGARSPAGGSAGL